MVLQFRGLGEFSIAMDKLTNTKELTDKVTRSMGEAFKEEAVKISPELTGVLKASHTVQKIDDGHALVVSTPYAAYQHEMTFDRRPPAENQWVIRAAARHGDKIARAARDEAERFLDGALLSRVAGSVIRGLYG